MKRGNYLERYTMKTKFNAINRFLRSLSFSFMLTKGGFAKVYLCTSLDTQKKYAVKIVPKKNLMKSRARQKVRGFFNGHP